MKQFWDRQITSIKDFSPVAVFFPEATPFLTGLITYKHPEGQVPSTCFSLYL